VKNVAIEALDPSLTGQIKTCHRWARRNSIYAVYSLSNFLKADSAILALSGCRCIADVISQTSLDAELVFWEEISWCALMAAKMMAHLLRLNGREQPCACAWELCEAVA
jgi:hypothetical protein